MKDFILPALLILLNDQTNETETFIDYFQPFLKPNNEVLFSIGLSIAKRLMPHSSHLKSLKALCPERQLKYRSNGRAVEDKIWSAFMKQPSKPKYFEHMNFHPMLYFAVPIQFD